MCKKNKSLTFSIAVLLVCILQFAMFNQAVYPRSAQGNPHPPNAPALLSPSNGATVLSLTPTLDWNNVQNASTYGVQVSTNSGFTSTVVNQTGLTSSEFTVPGGILTNNTLYYWRANAVNSNGTGPWSAVWNFTTLVVPPGQQAWVQRYNGTGNSSDFAHVVAVDGLGNVYVTGSSGIYPNYNFATIKYNPTGVQQWVQSYSGPENGYSTATSMVVDSSGNVYVTGSSWAGGTSDYATIKYNSSGVQQWVQRYNGSGIRYDYANSIAVDASGNVYVTGESTSSPSSGGVYTTIKYDGSGVQQWVQSFGQGGVLITYSPPSLAVDASGNVYVTGSIELANHLPHPTGANSVNPFNADYITIKYNSLGVLLWVQRYDGPGNGTDEANSITIDASGDVYVTGYSWGGEPSYEDYATIKYSSLGIQQWVQRYNGPGIRDDEANSIAVDGLGNVYVTGLSATDYATIKYNSSGVQQWAARYTGGGISIAVDGSGNVYVTGTSGGDYATIKYNSSGVQQWVERYNGPGNGADGANSIAVDASGNVYVTGYSWGSGTDYDFATIKYAQTGGAGPMRSDFTANQKPGEFKLWQNYPNPFNPTTKIKFSIPPSKGDRGMTVRLVIFDIIGREAATLVNAEMEAGSYEVIWDASQFSSGIYFYKLTTVPDGRQAGDFTETKKMLLVK